MPPEVAHRAYYRQPVWKRIVVIAAGPAVNIVARLRDPLRRLLRPPRAGEPVGGRRSAPDSPPRDRCSRATRSSPSTATASRPRRRRPADAVRQAGRLARMRGQAGRRLRRRDPGRARDPRATGSVRRSRCAPNTTTKPARTLIGFAYGSSRSDLGAGAAARQSWTRCGWSPASTGLVFAHIFESEAAQADLGDRRHQRRRQPDDRRRPRPVAAPARPRQPLARPDQPAADPAARRRPHLLEPGREDCAASRSRCG